MEKLQLLDELHALVICQQAISDILSTTTEIHYSGQKLAVLLGYLSERQQKILEKILE